MKALPALNELLSGNQRYQTGTSTMSNPVDARPEWSFEAGHLPGAVCLPFSFPTTQAYRDFSKLHSKTRPLIIYCGEPSCERSKYLAKKLRDEFEYSSLWLYEGGYEDYLTRTR